MRINRKKKLQPLAYLCIWSIVVCLISLFFHGEKKVEQEQKEEYDSSYMELIHMPEEMVSPNIRVMITNKKDNSIFYDVKDYKEVQAQMEEAGYRGKVYYQRATDRKDKFVVINELPLESYLYGVIPSEMPASYPMEALKAQAICARTYAMLHMMNPAYPDYDAHVNDTTSFQVYHKIDEQDAANKAVDETQGMLLFDKESEDLVETYYYSTSCGQTCEASTNVEFQEYITKRVQSDVEADESWYRWTCSVEKIDKAAMLERIQERQKENPTKILTRTVADLYESKVVSELDVIKELFISKRGEGGVGEELIISSDKNIYKIVGEYNIRYILNDNSAIITKQDGSKTTMNTLLPSAFISLDAVKSNKKVTGYRIVGGGYGHGKGMSQNGAKGLADLGYSAEEILLYYYPDSEISKTS